MVAMRRNARSSLEASCRSAWFSDYARQRVVPGLSSPAVDASKARAAPLGGSAGATRRRRTQIPDACPCSRSGARGMRLGGLRRYASRAVRRAGVALSGVKYVSGMEAGGVRWVFVCKRKVNQSCMAKDQSDVSGTNCSGQGQFRPTTLLPS